MESVEKKNSLLEIQEDDSLMGDQADCFLDSLVKRKDSRGNDLMQTPLKEGSSHWNDLEFLRNGSFYTISRSSLQRFPSIYHINTPGSNKEELLRSKSKREILEQEKGSLKDSEIVREIPEYQSAYSLSQQLGQALSFSSGNNHESFRTMRSKYKTHFKRWGKMDKSQIRRHGKWMNTFTSDIIYKHERQAVKLRHCRVSLVIDESKDTVAGLLVKGKGSELKIRMQSYEEREMVELWNKGEEMWEEIDLRVRVHRKLIK